MSVSFDMVSRELLNVVPPIMRTIKGKWKKGPIKGVTNTQFRTLMFIRKNPGTSLQDVARHLGLTSPTTSTTVDDLVSNQLVLRAPSLKDRRKITLTITESGQKSLDGLFEQSRNDLTAHLAPLTAEQRAIVYQGLKFLAPLFSDPMEKDGTIK